MSAEIEIQRAQELDSQLRALAHHAHVVIEAITALVEEAKAANIHVALGFPSWTAYPADALDGQRSDPGQLRSDAELPARQHVRHAVLGDARGQVRSFFGTARPG